MYLWGRSLPHSISYLSEADRWSEEEEGGRKLLRRDGRRREMQAMFYLNGYWMMVVTGLGFELIGSESYGQFYIQYQHVHRNVVP